MTQPAADFPQLHPLPRHVAIIMDGNNRWAKARHLPGISGHKAGVASVRAVIEVALQQGIQALTLFAFSSENWQRPADEVRGLMELFRWVLRREVKRLNQYQVCLKIIGDRSAFSPELQQLMQQAEQATAQHTRLRLNIAANYGGQWDITQACRKLVQEVTAGQLDADSIQQDDLARHLCLSDCPPPDLCIRTSGEQRISNFLLWQLAYSELAFSSLNWPDYRQQAFYQTLLDYTRRQRRFGGRDSSTTNEPSSC